MTEATITLSLEEYKELVEKGKVKTDYTKFYDAMAKFQEKYEPPKKDKEVNYTTNKGQVIQYDYADLESLQKAIRKAAGPQGLSWNTEFNTQKSTIQNYGKDQEALVVTAVVIINHSSGVEKEFKSVPLFSTSLTDPKSLGSTKTYAERYALSSAFGIASGEDDEQMVNDSPQEPSRAELDAELEQLTQEYKNFLLDEGIDMGAMNKWIIEQEGVNSITQVEPVQVMAYLKAQVLKIQKKQTEAEKQSENENETSGIWGNE